MKIVELNMVNKILYIILVVFEEISIPFSSSKIVFFFKLCFIDLLYENVHSGTNHQLKQKEVESKYLHKLANLN